MLELTSFAEAREALRSRSLRQALYDEGAELMGSVIVNLHGPAHTDRRRLENRLFSPDTIAFYEDDHLPAIIGATLDRFAPRSPSETIDLVPLARRAMMRLSIDVAGVDLPPGLPDDEAFDDLFALMHRLASASVVVHATGDKPEIVADGLAALDEFDQRYHQPSMRHRRARIDAGADLPRDILTTLLANEDRLALAADELLREVAYFPWVGSHSTAAQFVHAMHHVFDRLDEHPDDRARLVDDDEWRLAFVHESLRLHPASPVAVRRAVEATEIAGRPVQADELVSISIEQANRDPQAFGGAPDSFVPDRAIAPDIPRWGLTFGSGMHACLGRELAGGRSRADGARPLRGAVSMLIAELLARGATRSAIDPPELDAGTTRHNWGRYPVHLATG